MTKDTAISPLAAGSPPAAFTLRYRLAVDANVLAQTQHATERHVLTEVGGQRVLFDRQTRTRYLVDRDARALRPIDLSAVVAQMRALRAAIGDPAMQLAETGLEMRGRQCRRYRLQIDHPRLVASGDLYVTTVQGAEQTALHDARLLEQEAQPFRIALAPADVVVQSSLALLAPAHETRQMLALESLERGLVDGGALEEALTFRVVV